MAPVRFADFRLDIAERRLERAGVPVELGARAFDLLQALVENAGRLVTKGQLLDRVWPDVIVEEANLHVQMALLRKAIGRDAVATVPGRGYQFVLPLQPGQAAWAPPTVPGSPPGPAWGALPPLLGRDDDLARIAQALADPAQGGFVTITGAGGSGKTLLARHLAARFGTVDGAAPVWADLLELKTPDMVVPAVAAAAAVPGPPRRAAELAHALADARLLLVLDNAEHVLAAVAELAAALRGQAPGVRLLVTSQAPLRCAGEVVHALPGLSVPAGPCTVEEAMGHAAVALFAAHARQADRRFRLAAPDVGDVLAICSSLGGSALGVQLAAALLGQMPLAALRARLARQVTGPDAAAIDPSANVLRSALSWSYDLLPPMARQVFRRLAVAQGPLALPMVLALATAGADDAARFEATDALADLVDRSLVQCEAGAGGAPCYRLLEAPRALALECLGRGDAGLADGQGDERGAALTRLASAIAPLGDAVRDEVYGHAAHPVAPPVPLPVAADIVAAFEALLPLAGVEAAATAIRVADALASQAILQCTVAERLRWAAALRERATLAGLPVVLRARAMELVAALVRHSDLALRLETLSAAARLWREAGQPFDEFRALARGADCAAMMGRPDEAGALLARVRELEDPAWPAARRRWRWFAEGVVAVCVVDLPRAMQAWRQQLEMTSHRDRDRVQALHSLANAEQIGGDAASALPRLLEAVDIARRTRLRAMLHAFLLPNLVAAQVALGQLAAAREAAAEGWPHARSQDAQAWWADHLALLAVREGRPHTAARLLGLADAAYAQLKDDRQALEAQAVAAAESAVRSTLGEALLEALRAQGRDPAASEQVCALALAPADSGPPITAAARQ